MNAFGQLHALCNFARLRLNEGDKRPHSTITQRRKDTEDNDQTKKCRQWVGPGDGDILKKWRF
jgi:hypothetical protein